MNSSNLASFAYVSENYLAAPVRALCLTFPGLGNMEMRQAPDFTDFKRAHDGVLFIYPFVNPWCWMNAATVAFVDEIVDVLMEKYSLAACPLLVRGGSMGGYSALAYSMFSKHRISGVIANCPVTDPLYHLTERPDLPRTMHSAMGTYEDITELLKERSPNHHPEKLQNCKYLIVHGFKDKSVNKEAHSDTLVPLMKKLGLNLTYLEDETMAHCNPMKYEVFEEIERFTLSVLKLS